MIKNDKNNIKKIVIETIDQYSNTSHANIEEDKRIDFYISDSIEFVKVLIKLEEILNFEFAPEELNLDNIKIVSDLIDLVGTKVENNT